MLAVAAPMLQWSYIEMEYGECQAEAKPSIYSKYGQCKTIRIINTYSYTFILLLFYICVPIRLHIFGYTQLAIVTMLIWLL